MRVKLNGLEINYEVYGERGDWIILCHGLGGGLQSMRPVARRFADRYRVLIWDNRGIGGSDPAPPGGGYTIAEHAADLHHLTDVLGVERAIVHGVSWGGILAQRFTLDYPRKVRALIVDSSSSEVNEQAAKNWIARGELFMREGREALASAPTGLSEARRGEPSPEEAAATAGHAIDSRAYCETSAAIASLYEEPMTPDLGRIAVPTLAIVGADDRTAGVGGTVKLSRAIPGARLVIVPDCGHGVCTLAPEVFDRAVDELIATAPR